MARVKLRGFGAIDRRTVAARSMLDFRADLVAALGGEKDLSPQRRRLVDMTMRAALILDHVDAWIAEQRSLVNQRSRTLLPIVTQRTQLADHLARLLDKLGLDRVPQKVPTLAEYVNAHEATGTLDSENGDAPVAPSPKQKGTSPRPLRTAVTDDEQGHDQG
jgi:hypothetical protein